MAKSIVLADGVAFGIEGVTQTFGCIGKRGSGKTYRGRLTLPDWMK
jgi:ABC-type oligopeptide transport system ATPase subunit